MGFFDLYNFILFYFFAYEVRGVKEKKGLS